MVSCLRRDQRPVVGLLTRFDCSDVSIRNELKVLIAAEKKREEKSASGMRGCVSSLCFRECHSCCLTLSTVLSASSIKTKGSPRNRKSRK